MKSEDVTLEYYWKKAKRISPITGVVVDIIIKRVDQYTDTFNKTERHIMSTNGVFYYEHELTDYSI